MSVKNHPSRRDFIRRSVWVLSSAAALPALIPASAWSAGRRGLPNDRVQIGFIGVGKQGTGLLRGFLFEPGSQIVAVCDVDAFKLARARNMVEKHYGDVSGTRYRGCAITADFREILDRPDIDAVVIATPDHWHAVQVILAAAAGKDIYCEKPLSLTIAEARAMVNSVRKYKRICQTGSMQRSDDRFRFACELIQNGYIGEVKNVRVSVRTGFKNHPVICDLAAETMPAELDWDMWQGPAPARPYNAILAPPISFDGFPAWRDYFDYSGGGMTDWGAHHFDIAQWGLGMDHSGPVEIIPPDGVEFTHLTYRYASGTVMTADFDDNLILFTGTEGSVEVNRSYLRTYPENLTSVRINPNEIHLYASSNHRRDFLNAMRTRTNPITDVEIGARSVSVCHLGNTAMQLNRPLKWNPMQEMFENDEQANRTLDRSKRSPWRV